MSRFDYGEDSLTSAAQTCKHLKPRYTPIAGKHAADGISCSICSSWDGSRCSRRELDNVLTTLDID